jgi:hypothetical protein
MPQKSRPLTPYNSKNHKSHKRTPRARIHLKKYELTTIIVI